MIILILLFLLIACIVDLYINRKIYTPTFIFNAIWLITLALYELRLSKLQHILSDRTKLVFVICILSYNICFLIMKFIKSKKKAKERTFNIHTKFTIEQKVRICKYIAIIIFIIEVIYSKGVPLLWKIFHINKTYFDFGIPSLTGALYGLIICLGAYSFIVKSKDKYIYLAMGILIISRQLLISFILEAIICSICDLNKKIDYRKYAIIVIVVLLGFNILGNIRSGSHEMDNVFYAKEQYKNLPTTVKWVYSYMTFSITNLDNLVNLTEGGLNYGATTLSDLLPSVLAKLIQIKVNYIPYYLELENFNVSTYLPSIYLDFGLIGVAILNIFLAILGKKLYDIMIKNNSIRNRLLYAVFAHNIIFLFFVNMFTYLPIVIQFLYIFIIFTESNENKSEENQIEQDETDNKIEKVLVLMSTYNGERFLKEQIDSILNQKDVEVKLLVRDDGSHDNTVNILEEYKNNGKLDWYNGENLQSAKSFLNLLKKAEKETDYEYFAFADQDDFWKEDKLYIAVRELKKIKGDYPKLYFCDKEIVDENLNPLNHKKREYIISLETSMVRNIVTGCTMVMNRNLVNQINRYTPDFIEMHDSWIYRVCLAIGGKCIYDNGEHIKYRQHGNNVIGTNEGFTKKLAKRCKDFRKCEPARQRTAQEILKGYSKDIVSEEHIKILQQMSKTKRSLAEKIKLICNSKMETENTEINMIFKIAVLSNRI